MDLSTGKIYICRYVWFDESVFPFASAGSLQVSNAPTGDGVLPWGVGPIAPVDDVSPLGPFVSGDAPSNPPRVVLAPSSGRQKAIAFAAVASYDVMSYDAW